MLEERFKKLSHDLKLPPLALKGQKDFFHLSLENDLHFSIKALPKEGFFLFAKVAPLPTRKREDAFMYFMKANLLGQGAGNQTLGVDEEESFLTLSRKVAHEVSDAEFMEIIEEFANYLDYWKEETKKMQKASEESILLG